MPRMMATRTRPFPIHAADHRFFSAMSIVLAITIFGGFANTYGRKLLTGTPEVPSIIHWHAAVFACWLVLFVVQTTLVLTGRTRVHRTLGTTGIVLAVLMFVMGWATAISSARTGHTGIPGVEFPDREGFLLLNMWAATVFIGLVLAGWAFRRDPQIHKRLMLIATVGALLGPGASRLPVASGNSALIGVIILAFLMVGPAYDFLTRRRVHPAYIAGIAVALTGIPPVVALMASTELWHAIAARLI